MANEHDDDQQQDDIAGLRKAAKDGKAALTENEQLRRELMFAKAGIDTETRLGKMLLKTFEGSSLDELRAEAEEIGLIKPVTNAGAAGDDDDDDDSAQQQQVRNSLAGGAATGSGPKTTPDPMSHALTNFHEQRKAGVRREDAALEVVDRVLSAAASGDKRVIFDPDAWSRQAAAQSGPRG
jgi:ribosomal protein L12E/L44/L45/RPP1/RPP2